MANDLGYYNPEFYAAESLRQLEKSLGMASRVHRSFEEARNGEGNEQGEIINIKRPGTFTVQDAPSSAQDLKPEKVQITLAFWKEVKIALTDKERAFTGDQIIAAHIRPMARALAEYIDLQLLNLWTKVPNYFDLNPVGSVDVDDITNVRKVLQDLQGPVMQDPMNMFYGVDTRLENEFLQLQAFTQQQGAGDLGVNTQVTASLGRKFGFDMFATQNIPTAGTSTAVTGTITVDGAQTKQSGPTGTLNIAIATPGGGPFEIGDILEVTLAGGAVERYSVQAQQAVGTNVTLSVSPPLRSDLAGGEAIVLNQNSGEKVNMAFHRDAFALVFANLPETGNQLGAQVSTISDPISGLSLRFRRFYDGNASKEFIALDALFGLEVLNPDLATRALQA